MDDKKEPVWKPSHREEVIAALWFIAAFTALQVQVPAWLFIALFVKACVDTVCVVKMLIKENKTND